MRIALAGGTGVVGRHVEQLARAAGHDVVVLARSRGIDIVTGQGLNLAAVDVVIDVAGPSAGARGDAVEFFERATANLLNAEEDAGVGHHIALSVVGAARVNAGYYAGKRVQEDLVAAGLTEWTILRATQFFDFAEQIAKPLGSWAVVPKVRSQPVAVTSVAAELLRLAHAAVVEGQLDAHGVHEIAGPQERRIAALLREQLAARGDAHKVIEVPLPGRFGRGLRDGSILPGQGVKIDEVTFEDWLETRHPRGSAASV